MRSSAGRDLIVLITCGEINIASFMISRVEIYATNLQSDMGNIPDARVLNKANNHRFLY